MTGPGGAPGGPVAAGDGRAGVLADRLAAVLVHHDPGWRLPRHSTLARRFHVSAQQVEAAISELIGRHLVSQLPDGQLFRASPAQCLIPVPGVARLTAHVDPMGTQLACRHRKVSRRRVPEDIAWTLGMSPAQTVWVVRCRWDDHGEPAAVSTTYLSAAAASQLDDDSALAESARLLPLGTPGERHGQDGEQAIGLAGALHLELQPPPASVARALRLASGQPAAMLTVRFDNPESRKPVALTAAALRADLFRIVIESA
jgi:DNA-binding GntR family transcriptional regulator